MLAENFKTPDELNIHQLGFDTLKTLLRMLERGEIEHHKYPVGEIPPCGLGAVDPMDFPGGPTLFNMQNICIHSSCGTPACMLGWARWIAKDGSLFATESPPLDDLFMIWEQSDRLRNSVTPAQAAIALRNFLTTGNAKWKEVFSCDSLAVVR